ncbi:helix-turn-helix transcriptional regulator [Erythrobacter sp. THAF29]|uniref:ArsR/SmtB family transcription factor n=1 Tax=Erythrobacter sp. THAF29 TaxID=2587851 RepID=UPI0012AA955E|nr:metalloregulator ArsR/SmtB family transcription factor [Erythrobacter sp. THAF29]QFT77709.1 Transcriptional repressor SdpR [Erythrobacter sp. THAF29]
MSILNYMVDDSIPLDKVFRALGDPTRLRMVEDLAGGERTIGDLAKPAAMTLAGASKHVGVLEEAGLLVREKRGRERVCQLQADTLEAARAWTEHYANFWNERLDALGKALEEDGDE